MKEAGKSVSSLKKDERINKILTEQYQYNISKG